MAYLLVATLIWAFSFGLIKVYLTGLDPLQVAGGRLLLAASLHCTAGEQTIKIATYNNILSFIFNID